MIDVLLYKMIGQMPFGLGEKVAADLFGDCKAHRINRSGESVWHYADKILTFSAIDGGLSECTIPYGVDIKINEELFLWTNSAFIDLCLKDSSPKYMAGAVILLELGVSMPDVSGMDEEDTSDKAITFFRHGSLDDLVEKMKPYTCPQIEKR